MAQIIKNKKGFKVIKVTYADDNKWGGLGICDQCNGNALKGYYVAVLNSVLCERCYNDWSKSAIYHPEDSRVEDTNFKYMKSILNL